MAILQLLKLIPAIASFIFIGYPFSYFLLVRSRLAASDIEAYMRYKTIYGSLLNIILSFFIGTLISTIYLNILSLLGISFSLLNISIFSAVFLIISVFIFAKYKRRLLEVAKFSAGSIDNVHFLNFSRIRFIKAGNEKDLKQEYSFEQLSLKKPDFKTRFEQFKDNPKTRNTLKVLVIILISINCLAVLFFTFLFPIRFWDAISCWSLKAKAFFIDKNIFTFYLNHDYSFAHNSYPVYLSLIQTWIYIWLGQVNENLVKIIFPIFYFSSVFLVFNFFRKKFGELLAGILAFIFSSIPIVMDHGYIEYTNLLYSIVLFIAVYFFSTYISNEIAEINESTARKKGIIEDVSNYFYERKTKMSFNFKIHNDLDSVFKGNPTSGNITFNGAGSQHDYPSADTFIKGLNILSIDRYRKYSHLYISALFFALLCLIRSEGFIYCALFLLVCLVVYLFGLARKSYLKRRFKKVLITYSEPSDSTDYKEWKDRINARFIRNGDTPYTALKLFLKKLFLPLFFIITINLPWFITKTMLNLSFTGIEWQKAINNGINYSMFAEGFKRALSAFTVEIIYSSYDSTRAFLGSSYGPVLIILLILFIMTIRKAFTNGGLVFFLFTCLVFISSFISIIFIREFEGSIERYILPGFFLSFYWIFSNTFKVKN
ncbi:MAG: hypothetical protein PHU65_07940 [Actinomycetota bacterium]|nr:hypothetical protein [Actinomycetota bacterium]